MISNKLLNHKYNIRNKFLNKYITWLNSGICIKVQNRNFQLTQEFISISYKNKQIISKL